MLTTMRKKKWIALILALILTLSAAGCSFDTHDKEPYDEPYDEPRDKDGEDADGADGEVIDAPAEYNILEIYREAESVYALFTGYRPNIYAEEEKTVIIDGSQYIAVDINGCTTLAGLRSLCRKYFDEDLTHELMSKKVKDKYPLFGERSGRLYTLNGYAALFGYDAGEDYKVTLESSEGEENCVRISASMTENGREIPAEVFCTYAVTDDGVRFTSFELMAEALFEAYKNVTEYEVELPLDENDYITYAAAYGDALGTPYGNIIKAGSDGVVYYVMGVGNRYWSSGNFKSFHTYRVTSKDGFLESVEEAETFTKDVVLKNGRPYTGQFNGMNSCMAHRFIQGAFDYDLWGYTVYFQEDGIIDVSTCPVGTGPAAYYEGTYEYDVNTGTFTARLVGRYADNGEITYYPETEVTGKLYEYGGFVHFICEKSGVYALTVNDPLPLTFVPDPDGSAEVPTAVLSRSLNGEWHGGVADENGDDSLRLVIDTETAEFELDHNSDEEGCNNRYVGTYFVNPLSYQITAKLCSVDDNTNITVKCTWGYSAGADGTVVSFSILSCDVPKYQYLVGKCFVFK